MTTTIKTYAHAYKDDPTHRETVEQLYDGAVASPPQVVVPLVNV